MQKMGVLACMLTLVENEGENFVLARLEIIMWSVKILVSCENQKMQCFRVTVVTQKIQVFLNAVYSFRDRRA